MPYYSPWFLAPSPQLGHNKSPEVDSESSSDVEESFEIIRDGDLLDLFNEYEIFGIHNSVERGGDSEQGGVVSAPPTATSTLVRAFFFRLEHIVLNVADYPPAQTFVKYVVRYDNGISIVLSSLYSLSYFHYLFWIIVFASCFFVVHLLLTGRC